MPLIRKKKIKEKNDMAEQQQEAKADSLPIAVSVQHQNRKKMAYGGVARQDGNPGTPARKPDDRRLPEDEYMAEQWAKGSGQPAREHEKRPVRPEDEYMAEDWGGEPYAYGGMAEDDNEPGVPMRKKRPAGPDEAEYMANRFAEGGSVAEAIMNKRRGASQDEQVDLQANNGNEEPNFYYPLNEEAIKKEAYYHDDQLSAQPEDSNEHGRDIESDKHDMIEQIRRKMKAKRG